MKKRIIRFFLKVKNTFLYYRIYFTVWMLRKLILLLIKFDKEKNFVLQDNNTDKDDGYHGNTIGWA